jgi:hypothetical protein
MPTRMILLVILLALALSSAISGASLAQDAPTPVGAWDGTYSCIQGKTALHLTIAEGTGGSLTAVFSFGSLLSNPGVPAGRFQMTGTFDPKTDRLKLAPDQWLSHPPGFVTVGLDGKLACAGSTLVGKVVGGTSCTSFKLSRAGEAGAGGSPCSDLVASR